MLLRVVSLQDHQFILNHWLRCPPGVAEWGTKYLQLISPLAMNEYTTHFAGQYNLVKLCVFCVVKFEVHFVWGRQCIV